MGCLARLRSNSWTAPPCTLSKSVILCGGTIGSPHLLLRSGIGPANELVAAGVEPLVDRAGVGRNLRDHVAVRLAYRLRDDVAEHNMDGSTHPMPMYLRTTAEPLKGSTRLANDIMLYPGPLQSRIGGTKRARGRPR